MMKPKRPEHLRFLVVLVAGLVALSMPASVVAQDNGHDHEHDGDFPALTIAGLEGEDCPEDESFCFEVVEGSMDAIAPDTSVQITFENRGEQVHNLAITRLSNADPDHEETPPGERIAGSSDEVQPGEEETFIFHVPADADGLYLWCHVPGHENLGMWLQTELAQEETSQDPSNAEEDPEETEDDHPDEAGHLHGAENTHDFGTSVETSDNDFGWPSHAGGEGPVCLLDDDGDGDYDPGESLYLFATASHGHGGGDHDEDAEEEEEGHHEEEACGEIPGNAIRLLPPTGFASGSLVDASDDDSGKPTSQVHAHPLYFDSDGDGEFEHPDTIYLDLTGEGSVTVGDFRLTSYRDFAPGTVVSSGDPDITNPLSALPAGEHMSFDDEDVIYEGGDSDQWYFNVEGEHTAIEHNDVRLSNNIPDTSGAADEGMEKVTQRVDSMEAEYEGDMDEMDGQLDGLSETVDVLRTSLASNSSEVDEVDERLDRIEERLDRLETQIDEDASEANTEDASAQAETTQRQPGQAQTTPGLSLAVILVAVVALGLWARRRDPE